VFDHTTDQRIANLVAQATVDGNHIRVSALDWLSIPAKEIGELIDHVSILTT
jgi:hypothetical protein